MTLDVEYKVSLHKGEHGGRWNINKDKGTITFNLPLLYNFSKKMIAKWRGYDDCPNGYPCEEAIINYFIEQLIETDLIERVCIERAHQKIRLKGRSRCKPFCCVERAAMCMVYPNAWEIVRSFVREETTKVVI